MLRYKIDVSHALERSGFNLFIVTFKSDIIEVSKERSYQGCRLE